MALHRTRVLLVALLLGSCSRGGSSGGSGAAGESMPAGWSSADIGAVGSPGGASYKTGVYSLAGSGADIWDAADAFRFHYRELAGDGSMTARVLDLLPTDAWAKAGVMIRESLAPGSRYAMTVATPSNGVTLQYREQTGQGCGLQWGPSTPAPVWVRITRAGNTFTGATSLDGASWTTVGSVTIAMGANVYIGLCLTAHDNSELNVAHFDHVTWTGAGGSTPSGFGPDLYYLSVGVFDSMHGTFAGAFVQVVDPAAVPVGNQPPQVSVAGPGTVAPFTKVALSASASDADGDALRYAWIVPAGETTCSATSTETWTAPSQPGTYTLYAFVSDGHVWSRGSTSVTVSGPAGTGGVGNHPAVIRSFAADVVTLTQGQSTAVTVDAVDVEGDSLGYAWAAPGGGTITGSGPTVTWTAPAPGTGRPSKAGLWIWPRSLPAGCPFELSTDVPGVAFVGRAASQHFCDTWMPTWAADGELYSPWQDGVLLTPPFTNMGGWHAGDPTALNGWAKIHGDDPQDLLIPAAGELAGPRGNWSGRYPAAIVHHNGVLYYGVRSTAIYDPAGNLTTDSNTSYRYASGTFLGFYTSTDGGASWSSSPNPDSPLFAEPHGGNLRLKFGQPYVVDFGRNQQHSPDGKLYFVSNGSTDTSAGTDHLNDDRVYLCRATPGASTINNISSWEFWAGGGWSSNLQDAQPLFEWKNQVSGATVTWNPGLGKFIMSCYRNGYTVSGTKTTFEDFDTYLLESSSLTGPYKLVHYLPSFGTQGYYPNLPSKFLSADGRDGWFWYGANFSPFDRASDPPGSGYRMCQQRIRFLRP